MEERNMLVNEHACIEFDKTLFACSGISCKLITVTELSSLPQSCQSYLGESDFPARTASKSLD